MNTTSRIEELLEKIVRAVVPLDMYAQFSSSTTTGTIAAGATKISIINSGGANATITSDGTNYTLEPNETLTLDPGFGRRNGIVTFNATGTTIKIVLYRY